MKKSFKILFLINLLLLSVLYLYGQENKDKINIKKAESFTLSESQKLNADAALKVDAMTTGDKELYISPLNAPKWEKGGIFEGYTPKDEIQSLRTQNSKKFRNPDGSITAQIGGNYSSWTCTDDDLSYVPSMRLTYSPASGPCTPSFSYSSDYITNFTLSNINNSTGFSSGGYGDYSHLSTILVAGTSTTASLTSYSGSGNNGVAIWIDFNDNGVFETSERVGTLDNVGPSSTVLIPITIPNDASEGSHRLRVIYQYNVAGTSIDPCASSYHGEGEDYKIIVIENPCPSSRTLSISSLPSTICDGESVTFTATPSSGYNPTSYKW